MDGRDGSGQHRLMLDRVYRLAVIGRSQDAVTEVFRLVNGLLVDGSYDAVDSALATADLKLLGLEAALALLTSTLPAAQQLPARAELRARVEAFLADHPSREALLRGL